MSNRVVKKYYDRIMRLEDEVAETRADIREVYKEAKADGINVAVLRKTVSRSKKDREVVEEEDELLEIYEDECLG